MTQSFVFRILLVLVALSSASTAGAQFDDDSIRVRVEIQPAAPSISAVVLRGDSAFFLTDLPDSTAYGFDRKRKRFFTTRRVRNTISEFPRTGNAMSQGLSIVDSLTFGEVQISDEMVSSVVRDSRGKTIALRGPRVEIEKAWRRRRGLPVSPTGNTDNDDPREPHPTDWAPIRLYSYAADKDAIWLGLQHQPLFYLDFALGGILRVDRATHRVTVLDDSVTLHRSVSQIEQYGDRYLVVADGKVLLFDPSAMKVTDTHLSESASEIAVVNDTAFIAESRRITVASLRDGRTLRRGFHLGVSGNAIRYTLADSTTEQSWDTLAVIGAGSHFRIKRFDEWMKTAGKIVRASALEYYFPGDRTTEVVSVESADSALTAEYEGPNAMFVSGLDNPRLRPFLREALLEPGSYEHLDLAKILLSENDTAATPFLRVALKNWSGPYAAEIATALALLGDTTGNAWIHAALLDTLHSAGTLDTTEKIHPFTFEAARKLRDPRNVARLLELSTHPHYGFAATVTLLDYRSPELAQQLLGRIVRRDSMTVVSQFMRSMADTTFPMTPALRRAVIDAAKPLLYSPDVQGRSSAVLALARDASAGELPALIGALTLDEYTYETAVMQLVRLTGAGVEGMPNGRGTTETRAAAQRWWTSWYAAHAREFKPKSDEETQKQVLAIREKLNRR